ncbi:MAG: N-acetylmuramoyl-L-alanine amidase [Desulfitobacteriaceae bacterium]|nr:N-acetylmuramoyl-L-alanine amidase [Desulfitobacteriaceae bacterium]MDD4347105.1 N-acetylmuramoyl-L-alanine amidase [Desulfitobacteriaceae bacterium]MDD4400291.1 N-acetylmuramoyl-L-alanine amidase [Desulfitobacteriaceae bacterium]
MRQMVVIFGKNLVSMAALIIVGVMGILLFSVFWQGSKAVITGTNEKFVVMLDAGHGGYDPGAIAEQDIYEKEINLQIAKKTRDFLVPSGIAVILTREEDEDYVPEGVTGRKTKKQIDLNYRISMATGAKADIFVSIHVNSTVAGKKSGAETFYYFGSEESKNLAVNIQQELIKISGMNRRIAKPGDFYIIKNTSMPAVIVEVGYLSNINEREKLRQTWYQDQVARAIAKGIADFFQNK